jgi:PAS domain S-box-containing protein
METKSTNSYDLVLKQTKSKKESAFSIKKAYPAYIVLLLLIIASIFVRFFIEKNIKDSLSIEFQKSSASVMNRISAHYYKQIEVLNSMNGLYDLLVEVVKTYFELYATIPTRSYPSILSVSYIPQVKYQDLDQFIINAKNLGYFDYELKSNIKSEIYFPFVNIVPEIKNYHRIGIDLGNDEKATRAIYRARDNNKMTSTDCYIIRNPDTLGFYIFYPIYFRNSERSNIEERRKNFQGLLSLEINLPQFIKEALSGEGMNQNVSVPSDSTIIFEIIGTDDNDKEYSVYKSANYILLKDFTPILTIKNKLKIADKEYSVKFYTTPDYGGKFQSILPNISLVISIILSFAFFGFILTQMTNKARAIEIADRMTKSQRRIVDTSNDIIAVMDSDLNWKSMNPASLAILGYLPDELLGNKFVDNVFDKSIANQILDLYNNGIDDHVQILDIQMKNKEGEIVWVNWSFTFSITDEMIYCIGRNVTFEKANEEIAKLRSKQIESTEIISREANYSKSFFMKEISHQIRNSLTGILGYLQLIQQKVYESESELETYIDFAADSSEELFTYITDIDEAAKLNEVDTSFINYNNINLSEIFNNVKKLDEFENKSVTFNTNINYEENDSIINLLADYNTVYEIISDSVSLLSVGNSSINYDINVEINQQEGAVEIQIMTNSNNAVHELIELYKQNSNNIINILKYDIEDVLFRINKISSSMRLLRGSFKIESFGENDGNLVSLIFKSKKQL